MPTFVDVLRRLAESRHGLWLAGAAGASVSYAELGALVRGNARRFAAHGVGRGTRVAIAIDSDLEHVVALLALIALGAVPMSVKPRRGADDDGHRDGLRRLVARYGIERAYHTLPELGVPTLAWDARATSADDRVYAEVTADDLCLVQFSSGSLGDPKPVPIRHGSLCANLDAIVALDGRHAETWCWSFLPLSHDMGLIGGLLSNLAAGNPTYLSTPHGFLRRPTEFLEWSAGRDAGAAMPDFAIRYLVRYLAARGARADGRLLAGLRSVYCGAEPIRRETIAGLVDAAARWGFAPDALIPCYGMAEATLIVTAGRFRSLARDFTAAANGRQIACVGRPVPATEVVVGARGADGAPVPVADGVEATVFVRGPGVCAGYLDQPAFAGGWHDTGDAGMVRAGELYITGRVKDLIIVNGENLFPHDIEAVVLREAGVRDCMVMSEDDRFFVVIVPTPNASPALAAVSARIAERFGAAPAAITLGATAELVRTTSGKPMRQVTLDALRHRLAPPA